MEGNPSDFESIGSRLGFRVEEEDAERLLMVWRGTRFPAFLCLGIACALLFLSVPILQAIRLQGFESRVASLWYFPAMNLILLGIALFLLSLKRTITFDRKSRKVVMLKRNLFGRRSLSLDFTEVKGLKLGMDQVYSGFAVAGSTAGVKSFPAPSLRLLLSTGDTVLLERGGRRRLTEISERISRFLQTTGGSDF